MGTKKYRWIVDSMEEAIASVEIDGKQTAPLPKWLLPRGAKEGDVLEVTHDVAESGEESRLSIVVDRAGTSAAMDRSAKQVGSTARSPNDPGGDITL
jgi:DUF3006 family protein